jgi:hypothetical protein
MAVDLTLSYSERNDNKMLTLTDTTTWGGTNPAVGAIKTLTLDVSVTPSNGTAIVCDQINLKTLNSLDGGSVQADLVFELTTTNLLDGGVSIGVGDNGDELPDGVYTFTYVVDESSTPDTEDSYTESILVEGRIRVAVYELLRTLPTIYNCDECKTKEIMDTIFCYGLLTSMEAAGYVAKNEELINQLYTLERLVTNGSSYSW